MIATYKETSVFYTDRGKGSVVVLLHGFLENATMWTHIVDELSKHNRVICIDLLGHGKTDCLGYIHTMEEMAAAVKAVLKNLQIRKSYFVGHSMGGYVSLAFAKEYPQNVKGICLMNSSSQADTGERRVIRQNANEMARKNLDMLIRMAIPNLFAPENKEKYTQEIAEVLHEAKQTTVRGYIAANEGMLLRTNSEEILQQVHKRAIIVGKKDPVLNYESITEEAHRTQTPLIEFPNGHMSHIEDKEALIEFIKHFVK